MRPSEMIVERKGLRSQLGDIREVGLEEVVTFQEFAMTFVADPLDAIGMACAVFGIILRFVEFPVADDTVISSPAALHEIKVPGAFRKREIE